MLAIKDYKGWHIVVARNYGNTTINAYSDTPPVKQLTASSIKDIKMLIDNKA